MVKIEKQLTSIDYIILGLLQGSPLTGYGIRKVFETTALGNYSSSPGTIYPALARLQKLNLIKSQSTADESGKSVFQIQASGKKALLQWLERPIDQAAIQKKMPELVLRFAFMGGLVSQAAQVQFLQNMIEELKIYIQHLVAFTVTAKLTMDLSAQLALEHGISSYKNDLNWAKKALKTIKVS